MSSLPIVAVLLATHNPNIDFLRQQLRSIQMQERVQLRLFWSDDKSKLEIIEEIEKLLTNVEHTRVDVQLDTSSPSSNFLHMLKTVDQPDIGYFSFADQDDIWLPHKLHTHIDLLNSFAGEIACTHSNSILLEKGTLKFSQKRCQKHELGTLLVENCFQGCTMVLNRNARNFIVSNLPDEMTWYDWWIGSLISQFGNVMFVPGIDTLYRIHSGNFIGQASGFERLRRYLSRKPRLLMNQANSLKGILLNFERMSSVSEIDHWLNCFGKEHFYLRLKGAFRDRKRNRSFSDDVFRRISNIVKIP